MGRIVVIGMTDRWRGVDAEVLDTVAAWLSANGKPKLGERVKTRDLDVYDMTTLPEKGNGVDAIKEDAELVIALSVAGIDGRTFNDDHGQPDWFFSEKNASIHPKCKALGIPLVSYSQQPMDVSGLVRARGIEIAPAIRIYGLGERDA